MEMDRYIDMYTDNVVIEIGDKGRPGIKETALAIETFILMGGYVAIQYIIFPPFRRSCSLASSSSVLSRRTPIRRITRLPSLTSKTAMLELTRFISHAKLSSPLNQHHMW